ncbi:MAG: DUF1997 domain-containing protein [Oscillochloris sp.]|nr:DUF1997 domain-containing protein [Oscillochloris sp.]
MTASRSLSGVSAHTRFVDLNGQANHVFRFAAPVALAYEYFCDVPAVFRLLPDALDVYAYGPDRYRLIIGASDGHGHTMAAIFDLQAIFAPGHISIVPTEDGPPNDLPGIVFPGSLAAEAIFQPHPANTVVDYALHIEMSIPVPSVLRLMPAQFLQGLGERAMQYKMSQMVNGFTQGVESDFHAWVTSG